VTITKRADFIWQEFTKHRWQMIRDWAALNKVPIKVREVRNRMEKDSEGNLISIPLTNFQYELGMSEDDWSWLATSDLAREFKLKNNS
jgi:hypothetical protein